MLGAEGVGHVNKGNEDEGDALASVMSEDLEVIDKTSAEEALHELMQEDAADNQQRVNINHGLNQGAGGFVRDNSVEGSQGELQEAADNQEFSDFRLVPLDAR